MKYQQSGIKQFSDVEIKDFTWDVHAVNYDWKNTKAYVEVHAKEKHLVLSRTFEFDVPEEWTSENVINALMQLDCFSGSTIIDN